MSGWDHIVIVVVKSFNFIFRENALRILKSVVSLLGFKTAPNSFRLILDTFRTENPLRWQWMKISVKPWMKISVACFREVYVTFLSRYLRQCLAVTQIILWKFELCRQLTFLFCTFLLFRSLFDEKLPEFILFTCQQSLNDFAMTVLNFTMLFRCDGLEQSSEKFDIFDIYNFKLEWTRLVWVVIR